MENKNRRLKENWRGTSARLGSPVDLRAMLLTISRHEPKFLAWGVDRIVFPDLLLPFSGTTVGHRQKHPRAFQLAKMCIAQLGTSPSYSELNGCPPQSKTCGGRESVQRLEGAMRKSVH